MPLLDPTPRIAGKHMPYGSGGNVVFIRNLGRRFAALGGRPNFPNGTLCKSRVPLFCSAKGIPGSNHFGHVLCHCSPAEMPRVDATQMTIAARVKSLSVILFRFAMSNAANHAMSKRRFSANINPPVAVVVSAERPSDTFVGLGFYNIFNERIGESAIGRSAGASMLPHAQVVLAAKTFSKVLSVAIFDRACSMVLGHIGTFSSYVCRLGRQSQLAYPSNTGRMLQVGVA